MNDYQYAVEALNELKNDALLLTVANEHLTDEIYLIRIGNNIQKAIEVLQRDIASLKKEYPGKLMNEMDTDGILEKIDSAARRMLSPDMEIMQDHASGDLGRKIESYVFSITKAVEDIRKKIKGVPPEHEVTGHTTNVLMKVEDVFRSTGGIILFGLKIIACTVVLVAAVFSYLYFTMEKDSSFINEIASSQALMMEKKARVPRLEQEKTELENKRIPQGNKELTRQEKVAALDLELKIRKLDEIIDQTEAEISVQEKNIIDNQDKLDALRKKPFLKRLLKQ